MRSYVDRRAGRYIHSKLKTAKKSVYICTPYIDQKYVDELIMLANRQILVKLVSSSKQAYFDLRDYLLSSTIDYLYFKHLIVPKTDFVHAKILVIDNCYAVDGSANLTKNGLWDQVNYIHVYEDPKEIQEVINAFEKIWKFNKYLKQ